MAQVRSYVYEKHDQYMCADTDEVASFANPEERKKGTQDNSIAIGVQNNEETVRWLFDQHFAAVAGDTVAFEGTSSHFLNGRVAISSLSTVLLTRLVSYFSLLDFALLISI